MAIIVSPDSSTGWSETAAAICRDALEHLNVVGIGEPVAPEDLAVALTALQGLLKELPLAGYLWPKLSGETVLAWDADAPDTASLPADYFNYPSVRATVDGQVVPLRQIPHAQWVVMPNRTQAAPSPTHFYIDPSNVLHFWPIPSQDPQATVQYQRLVSDAVANAVPDVLQHWIAPLGLGVASKVARKYGVPLPERADLVQEWMAARALALSASQQYEQIVITVDG